jgi:hypothetical protein
MKTRSLMLPALLATIAACGGSKIEHNSGDQSTATTTPVTSAVDSAADSLPSSTDGKQSDARPVRTTTSTSAATTTSTQASTTTVVELGTIQSPLPVGVEGVSGFSYEEAYGDAKWDGFVTGLVETGRGQFAGDAPGRCLLLLGTLTPTAAEGATSSGFTTPSVGVIAGGNLIDAAASECDTAPAEAAGFGWILDANVTVGTTYPFYAEFFIPGDVPAELEVIVVGDSTSAEALYFEPTVQPTITPAS